MMNNYIYLQDYDFLKQVDKLRNKKQYVKIIILDLYERPIIELTGSVKDGGSLSIDGTSAIRRTSSLTLVPFEKTKKDVEEFKDLLSINKKVKIEIGFDNNTSKYQEFKILWFPLGIFLIQNPSFNKTLDDFSITISLSDKMCLLNGDSGGTIPADIELDKMETFLPEYDEDNNPTGRMILSYNVPVNIRQIIYELVVHMGGEQLAKTIVDIPEKVKVVKNSYENIMNIYDSSNNSVKIGILKNDKDSAAIRSFNRNQDIGFGLEDFTFPERNNGLTAAAGSSVTQTLDDLKNTLDNYEYFYDKDGNFIFQEIKNYLNTSESTYILNKNSNILDYLKGTDNLDYSLDRYRNKSIYSFDDDMIISCSNNPQYELVKNDFIIWGKNGNDIPLRYHIVLDDIPILEDKKYENYYFLELPIVSVDSPFNQETLEVIPYTIGLVKLETFTSQELKSLKEGLLGVYYYTIDEKEVYIYDGLNFVKLKDVLGETYSEDIYKVHSPQEIPYISKEDWRTQFYLDGVCTENSGLVSNDYYVELKNEWPKIIDVQKIFKDNSLKSLDTLLRDDLDPTSISYFIDILSPSDKINRFNVSKIGRRTQVISESDSQANCIFENDIPYYCYIKTDVRNTEQDIKTALNSVLIQYQKEINTIIESQYIPVLLTKDDYLSLITGGKLNSAYEIAKNAIYQGTGYNEKITLDTLPVYYLEPNTRITVNNKESGIEGDYIINSINLPLDVDGTMSLVCSRALDKL